MKVFSAGGTNTGIGDAVKFIIAVFVMLSCIILFNVLINIQLGIECTLVIQTSPHVTYLLGGWGLVINALTQMFAMSVLGTPFANPTNSKPKLIERFDSALKEFGKSYMNSRFGNGTNNIMPYSGYAASNDAARKKLDCPDREAVPTDFVDASRCFSPDLIYGMLDAILRARVRPFLEGNATHLENVDTFKAVWALMISPIYDTLVDPMVEAIPTTVQNDLDDIDSGYIPTWAILYVICIICEVICIGALRGIDHHMRRVLALLLHCPSSIILQTPRVMSVLCGDFSTRKRDDSTQNAAFFRSVVLQMPDAIITVHADSMVIASTNQACERIFGAGAAEGSIIDFFKTHFQGNVDNIISAHGEEGGRQESLTYQKDPQASVNLDVYEIPMGETIVYRFRDITQTVRYNMLISFERTKSDQMLKSILPPSLVSRVQAGEKNISFAVPSVSVVFMDIVSFTPWCGANQADKVMMTLNNMFKRFDGNCNSYPSLTRIKCIGDCYMAAGGVFDEVNQPAEHAKEVVSFGLDSLDSMGEMNAELGEKLQIRVGVNTGGPIVAGVLGGGVGKPTFEILGPAINMAQQMEHHGVPMSVHVSRAVYELVYGDTFVVKERGAVEVKGQAVVTYLVTGRTQSAKSSAQATTPAGRT
jgi:class 3 adenylate cyclase/PAS domain-containing protein